MESDDALNKVAQEVVMKSVIDALDHAEGMNGPTGELYEQLMKDVISECSLRIKNFRELAGKPPAEQWVCIFGNFGEGFSFVGPFNGAEAALAYGDGHPDNWSVVQLERPAEL